ncbi:MAG: tryptophan 7-halogenase [Planctomycetes bacterium]|nr:tryptophan 7-halogenase [Planctomycetota bacterium]
MTPYDVAIIGSGIGGSTLAAILARAGKSVLLLEAGSHPRFAIGESVVPEFGARARLLAAAYDLPELAHIAEFQSLRHHVSANSGVKRNFSFLHHTPGRVVRDEHSFQFRTMTYPLGPDSHVYRPDLDHWLTAVAISRGAVYRERSPVQGIAVDADGVTIETPSDRHRASFVVDGSGHRSVLAARGEVTQRVDSRSIFTHMVGVRRQPRGDLPSPPDQGTLHHLFDGGWFWVIPFDNHSAAVNPVCSVGLTLDRSKHPDNDLGAEEEFFSFVERFPTVADQFQSARPVRSWVKTGRLQYRSPSITGDRWCLLPHAAGFVDPLFSGGMTMTLIGVDEVARRILATGSARLDGEESLEDCSGANLDVADRMVHGAYLAFRAPELFNAWFRVWAVGNFHASAGLARLVLKHLRTGDREHLEARHDAPHRRILGAGHPRLRGLFEEAHSIIGELDGTTVEDQQVAEVAGRLFRLLGDQSWIPPQFRVADPDRRHLASFTAFRLSGIILWGKRRAPEDMRELYYDVGPNFYWELTKALGREAARSLSAFRRVVTDAHTSRGRA